MVKNEKLILEYLQEKIEELEKRIIDLEIGAVVYGR